MPITEELENVKKFESAGFSHEQAKVLAETLELAQVASHEYLKDFIRDEIDKLRIEFGNEFKKIHDQFKDVNVQFRDVHEQFKDVNGQFKGVNDQFKNVHEQFKDINGQFKTVHEQFKEVNIQFREVHDQFKDVNGQFKTIHDQFKDVNNQFRDLHKEINASELRMRASQTDLLVKIFGIVVGTVGVAVTILKLFPPGS
ncbi:MAG: hypothetical protein ACUBOA_07205 [Candidatus Loosdrechtia sp.]|uniref:hypothetical protein n=1 Tax=Candidatus Loosdrechtia sp. TaxID=3101272 RepID=UPI003A5FECAF|nr:MAG: hypothetical protein QY305_01150 [Candidatus Jettenia sp. AMX2]